MIKQWPLPDDSKYCYVISSENSQEILYTSAKLRKLQSNMMSSEKFNLCWCHMYSRGFWLSDSEITCSQKSVWSKMAIQWPHQKSRIWCHLSEILSFSEYLIALPSKLRRCSNNGRFKRLLLDEVYPFAYTCVVIWEICNLNIQIVRYFDKNVDHLISTTAA